MGRLKICEIFNQQFLQEKYLDFTMVYCYEIRLNYSSKSQLTIIGPIPPFNVSQNPMARKHKHER